MLGFFKKFKEGLSKTSRKLTGTVSGVLGLKKLDAASIDELEEALYGADFGVETTTAIVEAVQRAYRKNPKLHGREVARLGAGVLAEILAGAEGSLAKASPGPAVICLVGVNGSGKTTTTAKVGYRLREDGHRVLLAACDTFRAAANEQIRSWAERLGLELISSHHGADSAAVAFDALQAGRKREADFLLLDTAGRLHNKSNLMEELKKIRRVLQKQEPAAPHYSLLVLDASLGTNSIEQARIFHREFGLDGLIVTKLDGTSRGGAIAGIYRELKLPIFFLGLGEQEEDLQPFSVDHYVRAIFGLEEEEKPQSIPPE